MQQMMSPGMMKNLEMIKEMNYEQVKGMSKDQMQAMGDEMNENVPEESYESMAPKLEDFPGPYCAWYFKLQGFRFHKTTHMC